MRIVLGILFVIAAVAVAGMLTTAAIVAIRRDRGKHGSSGALGVAMLEIQSVLEPSKRHAVVAVRDDADSTSGDDSGEPPESAGVPSDEETGKPGAESAEVGIEANRRSLR